jgi:hypothetical protein
MQPITDTLTQPLFKELDHRASDGIEVSLLWNRADNGITVLVRDARSDEPIEIQVAPEHALDAFQHPFAYAAFQGLPTPQAQAGRELSIH